MFIRLGRIGAVAKSRGDIVRGSGANEHLACASAGHGDNFIGVGA